MRWSFILIVMLFIFIPVSGEEKVKLLMGFEKEEMGKWKDKRKPKVAEGDSTQGASALIRTFNDKKAAWYLKSGKSPEEVLNMQARVLGTFGRFRDLFQYNWTGYDRFRLDIKSTRAPATIRVMLEDELVSPRLTRDYKIKAGEWATLEFNLAEASKIREIKLSQKTAEYFKIEVLKVRLLNPAKMANIDVRVEQADNGTDILLDNLRLLRPDAEEKTELPVIKDTSPFSEIRELPFTDEIKTSVSYQGERNNTKVEAGMPVKIELKKRDSYGLFTLSRALTFTDNDRMLFGFSRGRIQMVQTLDGGKTWTDLKGEPGKSTSCQHSANAPGNGASSAGDDMLVTYTARCAGMSSPEDQYFRFLAFSGKGWNLGPPRLMCADVRHCPEHQIECIRLKNGRMWIAWHHIDRFARHWLCARYSDDGGEIWRTPSSNAVVMVKRRKDPEPLPLGVTLWQEGPEGWKEPDRGRAGQAADKFHPHSHLSIVPYGDSIACIFADSRDKIAWTYFDIKACAWTAPQIVCGNGYGGPASAVTVGEKTIYIATKRPKKIYRLENGSWVEDTPPGYAPGMLSVCGKRLFCFWLKRDGNSTNVMMSRKSFDGTWSQPKTLSVEKDKLQGITVPRYASGNVLPVIWGPKNGWIKVLQIPVNAGK